MPARVNRGFGQRSSFTDNSIKCLASSGRSSVRSLNAGTWTGNTFTQTIGHALELQTSSGSAQPQYNYVNSNYFFDLGADAIMYGNMPRSSDTSSNILNKGQIESNFVQGYGRMYPGSSGIESPLGIGTLIQYNDVNDGYQTGIGLCIPNPTNCDTLTNSGAIATNNTIQSNHVWNIGKGVTDDMGAIYVATYQAPNNQILNNRLHDINDAQLNDTDGYGGNGLYLDNGTGDVQVENNLVYRANFHAAQNTNGPASSGNSNTWYNNVLAYSRVAMFYDGPPVQGGGVPSYLELVRRSLDSGGGGSMTMVRRIDEALRRLTQAQWVPQLLVRLFVGYFFLETGWGKIQNLEAMTERFVEWGIPAPAFNAAFSGWTEFLGGLLIMLGLLTRLMSVPLFINMSVATLAVKLKKVGGLDEFDELDEPLYALNFLWLFFSGPGWVSLDHLLDKVLRRKYAAELAPGAPA